MHVAGRAELTCLMLTRRTGLFNWAQCTRHPWAGQERAEPLWIHAQYAWDRFLQLHRAVAGNKQAAFGSGEQPLHQAG